MNFKWIFLGFSFLQSLFCLSRNPGCLLVWRRSLPHPRRSWQGKNRLRYDVLPTQGRVPDPVSQNSSLFTLSPPVLVDRWMAQNLHTGTSSIVSRGNTKIFIKIFNADIHLACFSYSYFEQLQMLAHQNLHVANSILSFWYEYMVAKK